MRVGPTTPTVPRIGCAAPGTFAAAMPSDAANAAREFALAQIRPLVGTSPPAGAICCAFLAGPWTGRDPVQYKIAGVLIGIVLSLGPQHSVPIEALFNRGPIETSGGSASPTMGANGKDMPECMSAWDNKTHISKVRWREICSRTINDPTHL